MGIGTSTRHQPSRDHQIRWRQRWQPRARAAANVPKSSHPPSRAAQVGHFALHFAEMCVPMCVGFAIGDAIYFGLAGLAGYSKPFSALPELSVLVVTVSMTVPMTAWMMFRGMPGRRVIEMSAVMPVLAVALLVCGWVGIIAKGDLAVAEHGLMMPAMLVPMLLSLDFYTGRAQI
jgi:hypothetical protein